MFFREPDSDRRGARPSGGLLAMAARKRGNEVTIVSGARPLLEVQNLQIAYEKKGMLQREEPAPAVWNASFTLAASETLALVGESGSGKTTIARSIAGLMIARKAKFSLTMRISICLSVGGAGI